MNLLTRQITTRAKSSRSEIIRLKDQKSNEKVVSAMTQHYLSKMLLCRDDADITPVRDTELLVAEALLNKYEGEQDLC